MVGSTWICKMVVKDKLEGKGFEPSRDTLTDSQTFENYKS
jgi:hypothetical protein